MDYNQLREILVNTEALYNLWQSTRIDEEAFIRANGKLIEQTEKARLQKEQARARQVKFFEKKKAEGKKFLSAMVSAETYDNLCRVRDQSILAGDPKNLGEVLDELLSVTGSKRPIVETQTEITPPDQAPAQTDAIDQNDPKQNPPDQAPAQTGLPDVIQKIAEHRAAGLTWPAIATALNEQGILTARGGAWTGPNCQTFFKRSHKS